DHHASAAGLVMIKPDEATVTVFCVEVRPLARQNVGMEVDLHAGNWRAFLRNANRKASDTDALQRFHRLRLFDSLAALLADTTRIVIPEIEHRLAEVLNDICAVEMDVFHQ